MRKALASQAGRLMALLFIVLLACGGATERSGADTALLLFAATISATTLAVLPHDRLVGPIRYFPWLVVAAILVQLAPLPYALVRPFWPPSVVAAVESVRRPEWAALTLNLVDTLYTLAVAITLSLVAAAYACLDRSQRKSVYKAILYGVGLNLMVATAQYMLNAPYEVGYFGYPVTIGVFQNGNHFATLILIAIPALVYLMRRGWVLTGLTALALALLLLLGSRSLAGAVLAMVMIALSFLLVPRHGGEQPRTPVAVTGSALFLAAGLFAVGFYQQAFDTKVTSGARRVEIWEKSLEAARGSMWLGAGYGAFQTAYQLYEKPQDVDTVYINSAHDEYVSMLVEGGAPAAALMALYFALLARQAARNQRAPYRRIALLGVLAVLLHSAVDYPARAFAILFVFAILNVELFLPEEAEPERRRVRRRHSGATTVTG